MVCRIYKINNGNSSILVNGLLDLLLHQSGQSSTQAASDILALLVGLMYSESGSISQEWQPLAKFAGVVLQSLTEKVLDVVLESSSNRQLTLKQQKRKRSLKQSEETHPRYTHQSQTTPKNDEKETSVASVTDTCEVMNIYQLVLENPRVPQEALERYFTAQLVQTLTHRPNIKLTKVLKKQKMWCSAEANRTLIALLQKVGMYTSSNNGNCNNVDCHENHFNNNIL